MFLVLLNNIFLVFPAIFLRINQSIYLALSGNETLRSYFCLKMQNQFYSENPPIKKWTVNPPSLPCSILLTIIHVLIISFINCYHIGKVVFFCYHLVIMLWPGFIAFKNLHCLLNTVLTNMAMFSCDYSIKTAVFSDCYHLSKCKYFWPQQVHQETNIV